MQIIRYFLHKYNNSIESVVNFGLSTCGQVTCLISSIWSLKPKLLARLFLCSNISVYQTSSFFKVLTLNTIKVLIIFYCPRTFIGLYDNITKIRKKSSYLPTCYHEHDWHRMRRSNAWGSDPQSETHSPPHLGDLTGSISGGNSLVPHILHSIHLGQILGQAKTNPGMR